MTELILGGGEDALPVLTVSIDTAEYVTGLVRRVGTQKGISNADEKAQWAADLNALHKCYQAIDAERLRQGRAYDLLKEQNVNAIAKPLLAPLAELRAKAQGELQAWDRKEREAAARRQAEIDAERAVAAQLEAEARRRQEEAALAVEKATTDGEFAQAATAFDKGVAQSMQATEILIAASDPQTAASGPVKVKGVKERMKVAELEVTNLAALPLAYHLPDEAKIKRHILDGTLTEGTAGIRFRLEKVFSAVGR